MTHLFCSEFNVCGRVYESVSKNACYHHKDRKTASKTRQEKLQRSAAAATTQKSNWDRPDSPLTESDVGKFMKECPLKMINGTNDC